MRVAGKDDSTDEGCRKVGIQEMRVAGKEGFGR